MGSFQIFSLAGGEQGLRHFMQQFGPALKLPWTRLVAPELDDGLLDKIVTGAESQMKGHSIAQWESYRDDCLLSIQDVVHSAKTRHGISD